MQMRIVFLQFLRLVSLMRLGVLFALLWMPAAVAFLAAEGIPPIRETVFGILTAVAAVGSVHTLNDFFDRDIDRLNRRTRRRPLAARRVAPHTVLIFSCVLGVLSLGFASLLNRVCLGLLAIGLTASVLYSAMLKRMLWGFLVPALATVPFVLGAWASYRPSEVLHPIPWLVAFIGVCFELQPYWCHTILDVEGDRKGRAKTIPNTYGTRFTGTVMLALYIVSLAALIMLWSIAGLSTFYLMGVLFAGGLVLLAYVDFVVRHVPGKARWLFVFSMGYITMISMCIVAEKTMVSLLRFVQHVQEL